MFRDRMTAQDVERISGAYFIEGPSRRRALSSFILLILSAIIAGAGIIADSTATVIGAMIVAPLMRPILGAAAAIVLARAGRSSSTSGSWAAERSWSSPWDTCSVS